MSLEIIIYLYNNKILGNFLISNVCFESKMFHFKRRQIETNYYLFFNSPTIGKIETNLFTHSRWSRSNALLQTYLRTNTRNEGLCSTIRPPNSFFLPQLRIKGHHFAEIVLNNFVTRARLYRTFHILLNMLISREFSRS